MKQGGRVNEKNREKGDLEEIQGKSGKIRQNQGSYL